MLTGKDPSWFAVSLQRLPHTRSYLPSGEQHLGQATLSLKKWGYTWAGERGEVAHAHIEGARQHTEKGNRMFASNEGTGNWSLHALPACLSRSGGA